MTNSNMNPKGIKIVFAEVPRKQVLSGTLRTSELKSNGNPVPVLVEADESVSLEGRVLVSRISERLIPSRRNTAYQRFIGARIQSYLLEAPRETDLMLFFTLPDSEKFCIEYYSGQKA